MKRLFAPTFAALALLGTTAPAALAAERPDSTDSRHVVVVSIDGLRPDAIEEYGLETLQWLMERGSYAIEASTINPSKTLPSHTSMLTGRPPEEHGITFNRALEGMGVVEVPTVFELARQKGYRTAGFFSKAKFRHLDRPGAYDYRQVPSSNADNWMATRTVPDAVQYMRHRRPNLLFIHIGETDYAGHTAGWMGSVYGMAARRADGAIERIVEAADETYGVGAYTLIVTADHGGHGHGHGSESDEDRLIPWIIYGKGVQAGTRPATVSTMDTAATTLWLLGIEIPTEFDGKPVFEALGPVDPSAATPVAPAGS